jgi:hypothetical protein
VENILNQVIEPEKPIEENVKKTPSIVPVPIKKATTTPAKKPTATTTPKTATSTSTTTPSGTHDDATTTPAGTFERTTDGDSNQFAPLNYYIPFDKLSPEMTYGLSALAMALGILGAVFVLQEPRTADIREPRWVPAFGEQSLLEP